MNDVRLARCVLVLSCLALALTVFRGGAPTRSGRAGPNRRSEAETVVGREAARQDEMDRLAALTGDADVPGSVREAAGRRLMELAARREQEKIIEDVLKERGYPGAAATVQAGSVNVIVEDVPDAAEAGAVMELASRETGIAAENIRLIPARRLNADSR